MLIDIPEKQWNVLNHNFFYYSLYLSVEVKFSSKYPKPQYHNPSKIASMDWKSPRNLFQMAQKLVKDTFDSTSIIFDHFDHVTAKVDRDVPVQVIRMVIWLIKEWIIQLMTRSWPFWWPERVHPGPLLLLHGRNDQIWLLCYQTCLW